MPGPTRLWSCPWFSLVSGEARKRTTPGGSQSPGVGVRSGKIRVRWSAWLPCSILDLNP